VISAYRSWRFRDLFAREMRKHESVLGVSDSGPLTLGDVLGRQAWGPGQECMFYLMLAPFLLMYLGVLLHGFGCLSFLDTWHPRQTNAAPVVDVLECHRAAGNP
jgi:hypothetical protein